MNKYVMSFVIGIALMSSMAEVSSWRVRAEPIVSAGNANSAQQSNAGSNQHDPGLQPGNNDQTVTPEPSHDQVQTAPQTINNRNEVHHDNAHNTGNNDVQHETTTTASELPQPRANIDLPEPHSDSDTNQGLKESQKGSGVVDTATNTKENSTNVFTKFFGAIAYPFVHAAKWFVSLWNKIYHRL